MRLEYELKPEDWAAFAEHCVSHSRSFQRTKLGVQSFGALALLLATFSTLNGRTVGTPLVALALASAWWFVTPPLMYRSVRRQALVRDRPCLRGRHSLEASPDGLRAKCDVSESLHKWTGVRGVESGREHVFFLIGEGVGYTVPRSRIVSGDLDAFVRLAGEHAAVDA